MENMHIALLGLGTIGKGVYEILDKQEKTLCLKSGGSIVLDKILVSNINKPRIVGEQKVPEELLTTDIDEICNNPKIQVVIEVIGGDTIAKDYIMKVLEAGKSVVTANKDVMAKYGALFYKVAADNSCDILYEASVGAGIPVIRGLVDGLASDNITRMMGIVNGTTNFILSKMAMENMSYAEALQLATDLGFAEPDPSSDVDGLDAARKMVILSSLGFSMPMELKDVYVRGIRDIPAEDIEFTRQLGFSLKLIGYADIQDGAVEVSVQPTLITKKHPMASVQNENNAIYLYGDAIGETMFYGPGAGAMPTATAIASDLIAAIKRKRLGVSGMQLVEFHNKKSIKTDDQILSKFYMHLLVDDEVGVLHEITGIFTEQGLSFESVIQKGLDNHTQSKLIIVTHDVILSNYLKALHQIEKLDVVKKVVSSYRVALL